MSPATNPVTLSLNVMVTGMGDRLVGSVDVEVMTTVGGILSYVLDSKFEAMFPLAAASVATFSATLTVTGPAPDGVILAL